MFVSCDHCHAEYELDDAKVPAGGARLRCTNCENYFVIVPPEPSDLQSAEDLAHDALSNEAPGGADLDRELEAAPEEDLDPDGESDWEFNDAIENSEPEVGEEEREIAFDRDDASGSGLELDVAPESAFDRDGESGDLPTVENAVDDLLESAGAIDADAATAVDTLLGEIDTAELQRDASSSDLASGSESPIDGGDLGDAGASDETGRDLSADVGDSLRDLSGWGAFDESADAAAPALSARAEGATVSAARSEPRVELGVSVADDSPTSVRWFNRVVEAAGWGAVLSLLIVALVGGLASKSTDARAPAASWSGAGFEADQIAGRWVENAVAGSIYVVSGRVRAAPGSDRTSRKTLGIRLIDTAGREIDRAPVPLAPAIPERILRESSPAELDAFQARRAGRISAVGERWVSFEAVLFDLPRSAGRFEIQALGR